MNKTDYILLPYQQRWVNDNSQLKIWLASRQIGKSFGISVGALKEALASKCDNLLLSGSDRQSKELMRKILEHMIAFEQLKINDVADHLSKTEISLKNGSRIISLPANPDTVRGFSGNVFLDEFAFHQDSEEIWRAMYPSVTRGFKIRICSTPNGKQNMFYNIFSDIDNGFSKHKTTIQDAYADGLKVDIEQLRKGVRDADTWAQEFECAFIDSNTAYLTYKQIQECESEDANMIMDYDSLNSQGEFYAGIDIGRRHDLTLVWILEKVGDVFWTRMVHGMRNVPFAGQRKFIFGLLDNHNSNLNIRRACFDATGLGMQLAEEATEAFGTRVEAVTFTTKVKEDMAVTLKRNFEDHTIRIPSDKTIREDLHSMQKITTASGNIRFDAKRTSEGHADRFWGLALATHAGSSPALPVSYHSVIQRRGIPGSDDVNWREGKGSSMRPHDSGREMGPGRGKGCY